jgi:hypothetical protein
MKRVIKIALVLVLVIAGSSFATSRPKTFGLTAIGAYGSYGFVGNMGGGGIGLSFKFDSFPVVGLKYDFGQGYGSFGASVDWYILDSLGLVDAMTYFIGVGGFFSIGTGNNFNLGLRGNFGLQFWPVHLVELYLDLIPALTFFNAQEFTPGFGFGIEAGLRFHF